MVQHLLRVSEDTSHDCITFFFFFFSFPLLLCLGLRTFALFHGKTKGGKKNIKSKRRGKKISAHELFSTE